jgi:hypothetical protein
MLVLEIIVVIDSVGFNPTKLGGDVQEALKVLAIGNRQWLYHQNNAHLMMEKA